MTKLLNGHLVIFVDGYKYHYKHMCHFLVSAGNTYSVPDTLMPASADEIGSMSWWEDGWAVGDNPRDRLCKRMGAKSLKKFYDFDEAVRFCYARQKKFKQQQCVLVYVYKNHMGREIQEAIRSLDEITAIDAKMEIERQEIKVLEAKRDAELNARYPEFEQLTQAFGHMKAYKISRQFAEAREMGVDSMKKSTRYRLKKELKAVGIEFPDLSPQEHEPSPICHK